MRCFNLLLIVFLFLTSILGYSQDDECRLITTKLDTFYGKQYYDGKKIILIKDNGETISFKPIKVLSIRRELEGWNYVEWGSNEITNSIKIPIDTMSKQQLFDRTLDWIKDNFNKCPSRHPENKECGILRERDSLIKRDSLVIKGFIKCGQKKDPLQKGYYSCIDYENYEIKLVSYNKGGLGYSVPGLWTSPLTLYAVNFNFGEGGFTLSPIHLRYIWSEQNTNDPTDYPETFREEIIDNILTSSKVYYTPIPLFNTKDYNNKSGIIRFNRRCLVAHVETFFNDLSRSLYNYILNKQEDSELFIYYPGFCFPEKI